MIKFALIGAAGYVAPRHIQAIKDVGGELVAALDPHDSVGILDKYFPGCQYFREPERFDRWLSKNQVDYVSVCSPNYLHDSHCLMAMRNGADVICEKPLTCNERNLDNLLEWEEKTGKKVNVVLQCRLHPEALKAKRSLGGGFYDVHVEYCTPRGEWYLNSWKGDVEKSGGLPTNIGIHLFDLCLWLFGEFKYFDEAGVGPQRATGGFQTQRAHVLYLLSIQRLEAEYCSRMFRITSDKGFRLDLNLTNGFTELHTELYKKTLAGEGFGIEDIRPATRIVEAIRNASN